MEREASGESLGESFRQARREMWVMLGAWATFLLWTGVTCTLLTRSTGAGDGGIATFLGIPRWAAFGIAVPWIFANVFIFWFTTFFMKDTDLRQGESEEEDGS